MMSDEAGTFPCFAIKSGDGNGFIYQGYICYRTTHNAVVLLTDEEVAEQYLTDNELAGEPLKFNSVKELLVFLASLPRAIDHVTIDPGIGKPNIIAKYHVIRRLKEMFNC